MLADGRVESLTEPGSANAGPEDEVIDARGLIVSPGLIDPHVHLRDPGAPEAETIESGSNAAIAGGFTTVCCMPNTTPTLDSPEMIEYVRARAERSALCRVFAVGAVSVGRKGAELAEIGLMNDAGAVAFSDDGDGVASAGLQRRAFEAIAETGSVMMQHCQEPTLTVGSVMNAGPVALRMGLTGWPSVAETLMIERDIRLNGDIGCRYHVQHISAAESVEVVRRARQEGLPVTAEASPHHLLLTEEACEGYNTAAKMNPPLRRLEDVKALRLGVADGTITILATDHAPHTRQRKALEFDHAPFGIIGLETALPLYAKALIETGLIDWPALIRLMTINPARLCRLDAPPHRLGSLAPGSAADVTLIAPDRPWTITEACLAGKSNNTPFFGMEVKAAIAGVIVGGVVRSKNL